jgi:hypothetical protein
LLGHSTAKSGMFCVKKASTLHLAAVDSVFARGAIEFSW